MRTQKVQRMNKPNIEVVPLQTKYGEFNMFVFSWGENEQDNILVLQKDVGDIPTVRIQSACYTGEIFESLDCDCHWQLETALEIISDDGGLFVYMLQDGRGAGLLTKIRGMALTAKTGIDTADAYKQLGSELDPREYTRPVWILNFFDVTELKLLTNNPRKVQALVEAGFKVHRHQHESIPTQENEHYLSAKRLKLGHLLNKV